MTAYKIIAMVNTFAFANNIDFAWSEVDNIKDTVTTITNALNINMTDDLLNEVCTLASYEAIEEEEMVEA